MIQLLREWPPGYGGVERVAHELATAWMAEGDAITTVCLGGGSPSEALLRKGDALPVDYPRIRIPTLKLGKLRISLPSVRLWQLLTSRQTLLLHLPCPMLLAIGVIAWRLNPRRSIGVYWHAFVESEQWPAAVVLAAYEWLALRWLGLARVKVITTSPVLADQLAVDGVNPGRIAVLPCCLPVELERLCLQIRAERQRRPPQNASHHALKVVFVGRLGSYKRVDLLIQAFAKSKADELHVIGDGDRTHLMELADFLVPKSKSVFFYGRLEEAEKLKILAECDVLFLPSYLSNEAFGIVQLEAMACGLAVCAPTVAKSGLGWVGSLGLLDRQKEPATSMQIAMDRLSEPVERSAFQKRSALRYDTHFSRRQWDLTFQSVARPAALSNLLVAADPKRAAF